jgi:hypothetical protein
MPEAPAAFLRVSLRLRAVFASVLEVFSRHRGPVQLAVFRIEAIDRFERLVIFVISYEGVRGSNPRVGSAS